MPNVGILSGRKVLPLASLAKALHRIGSGRRIVSA
jgi:hypothetical protein